MTSMNDQTITAYEQGVAAYAAGSPQSVDGALKAWVDASLAELPPNAKIFEIGSGTGKDADYIENLGYSVERTDATQAFVELQRKRGHQSKRFNLLRDAFAAQYDMIFSDAVLLHLTLSETEQAIKKIYDALLPSGRFAFSLKQGDGEEITDRKLGTPRYFRYWQPNAIDQILRATGFRGIALKIVDDYRGNDKPAWLLITAQKGAAS